MEYFRTFNRTPAVEASEGSDIYPILRNLKIFLRSRMKLPAASNSLEAFGSTLRDDFVPGHLPVPANDVVTPQL